MNYSPWETEKAASWPDSEERRGAIAAPDSAAVSTSDESCVAFASFASFASGPLRREQNSSFLPSLCLSPFFSLILFSFLCSCLSQWLSPPRDVAAHQLGLWLVCIGVLLPRGEGKEKKKKNPRKVVARRKECCRCCREDREPARLPFDC